MANNEDNEECKTTMRNKEPQIVVEKIKNYSFFVIIFLMLFNLFVHFEFIKTTQNEIKNFLSSDRVDSFFFDFFVILSSITMPSSIAFICFSCFFFLDDKNWLKYYLFFAHAMTCNDNWHHCWFIGKHLAGSSCLSFVRISSFITFTFTTQWTHATVTAATTVAMNLPCIVRNSMHFMSW